MSKSKIPLWRYAEHTKPGSTHHRAFWNALEDAMPEGLIRRIEPGGDVRGIWEAEPAEARPAQVANEWRSAVQALNLSQPDARTCQAACIGMAVGDKDIQGIRRKLDALGSAGSPAVMARVINGYGVPYAYSGNACLADVIGWLQAGEFLITHGWFTGSGHVICLDGLKRTPKGSRYLFNVKDPWSEFNGPAWRYDSDARFFDGFYSELLIYAACVAGTSAADASARYRAGAVDRARGGMWVHRFLTASPEAGAQ